MPSEARALYSILSELHETGVLLLLGDRTKADCHVVLKPSQLTNKVHELLFSKKNVIGGAEFNIGILPNNILEAILPPYIPKQCLSYLQYCQEIKCEDVSVFTSLTPAEMTLDQSYYFFPALCSVDKSELSWVTPPDLSYNICLLYTSPSPRDRG